MAQRAGSLAVAGEALRGDRIERHAVSAAREDGLRNARAAEQRGERADVDVLARVRARHQREFLWGQVERGDATRLDQCDECEGLGGRPERDGMLGVADDPEDRTRLVHFDDVPAMAALDHVAAEFLDEHRRRTRRGARAGLRPRAGARGVGPDAAPVGPAVDFVRDSTASGAPRGGTERGTGRSAEHTAASATR